MGESSCFFGHLFQHIWVSLRIVHLSLLSTKEEELMSFDHLSTFFNSFDPAGLMLVYQKAEIAEGSLSPLLPVAREHSGQELLA